MKIHDAAQRPESLLFSRDAAGSGCTHLVEHSSRLLQHVFWAARGRWDNAGRPGGALGIRNFKKGCSRWVAQRVQKRGKQSMLLSAKQ